MTHSYRQTYLEPAGFIPGWLPVNEQKKALYCGHVAQAFHKCSTKYGFDVKVHGWVQIGSEHLGPNRQDRREE